MIWAIDYSAEARNYLYDSYPYTEPVLIEIERLRLTKDAVPAEGCTQIEPQVYMWDVLHHMVLFEKVTTGEQPKLKILTVKPLE